MNEINWLSMALATLMPITIGSLYYHKAVFGNAWMGSIGRSEQAPTQGSRLLMLGLCLVLSFFLSFFLLNFNNDGINQEGDFDTFQHGAWHGMFVAITVAMPILFINGYFAQTTWKNRLINLLYWII
ncbi:MAG: DUF1761 domain-containing protein, partial [Bacteroidota bacterium]